MSRFNIYARKKGVVAALHGNFCLMPPLRYGNQLMLVEL
jgi:hypothetical protein